MKKDDFGWHRKAHECHVAVGSIVVKSVCSLFRTFLCLPWQCSYVVESGLSLCIIWLY